MLFKLEADCEFEAVNIDDAFFVLYEHFKRLFNEGDYDGTPFKRGEIHIVPINTPDMSIPTH